MKTQSQNKFDQSSIILQNSDESASPLQSQFTPSEKFLNVNIAITDKIADVNKSVPYYPLPSNEGYEKFLQRMKKEQYKKTQYSLPFLLSLRKKYEERPANMKEIKIPLKNEIRSRAKILTDEAFRETRNYLDVHTEVKNPQSREFLNNLFKKIAIKSKDRNKEQNLDEVYLKTAEIREWLNKISIDNFDYYCDHILKCNYDDILLENFKAVTEKNYSDMYVTICFKMFKLYNKKDYPNNTKMNFKSLLLKKCQEEFYDPENTSIAFPFHMDEEERIARLREIKLGNIRLIGDFYLHNTIPIKIISECIDFLLKKIDDLNIRTLCELIKKICKKLYVDDLALLEKAVNALESLYHNKPIAGNIYASSGGKSANNANNSNNANNTTNNSASPISSKTKFLILDVMDLKKISYGLNNNIYYDDQLRKKCESSTDFLSRSRKNSEIPNGNSRKSSINPTNVDYIRRSRFNSRADELKTTKEASQNLINELVSNLGADIEFYQCFRLTEEEFAFIKKANNELITEFEEPSHTPQLEEIKTIFNKMMQEIQCEKFIAVGHLLENMFSLNVKNSNVTMNVLTYLYRNLMIDQEDIKHGIVLGLVNFKDNVIDYPNSKEYLQKFLQMIKDEDIIDEKLLEVYQKCCANIEKC